MIRDLQFTAGPADDGVRMDRVVLAHAPSSARRLVLEALDAGTVLLNGRAVPKGAKVQLGDGVFVERLAETADLAVRPNAELPLDVLAEDAALLALDKPAGRPCHPLRPEETDTLANALVARFPEQAGIGDHPMMAGLLHRIDTGTSGLVLAARTAEAFAALRAQFRARAVEKMYLAVVCGTVRETGTLLGALVHEPAFRGRMRVLAEGDSPPRGQRALRAETRYEPLARHGDTTLLRVTIFTGVTHQIRCQLAAAGFPLVNDDRYGWTDPSLPPGRHLLHAWRIRINHPVTNEPAVYEAPPPRDLPSITDPSLRRAP